ncbi:MAG: cysteine desulfurase family protein [Patescibacteria group bacterium]
MTKRIYLDYASTTPLDPRVLKAMVPYFSKKFGNPSSIHAEGLEAKKAVDVARLGVARLLEAHADEIVFTSGGTESNNLAIFGVVKALEETRRKISEMHFVTTVIEHSSVLECFRELESRGAKVDYVEVKENGVVDPQVILNVLRKETVLVSVGYANNEIGTIQPIREISKLLSIHNSKFVIRNSPNEKKFRTFFHSDGSQAPLYLDCKPEHLGVDLLTLDGHKMYGPKGVGALYLRRGTALHSILAGGGQERGLRSTTENVPGIIGFAKAFEIADSIRKKESERLTKLRDYFYSNVLQNIGIEKVIVNGDLKLRLPNNVNISIPGFDSEFGVLKLDALGIACSTKSSCLGSSGGSYVVEALGGKKERSLSTLRFTFGRETKKSDLDYLLKALTRIIQF